MPPRWGNSHDSPLPKLPTRLFLLLETLSKYCIDGKLQKWFKVNATNAGDSEKWSQLKHGCLPCTNPRLLLWFVPSWIRRIQQRRLRVAFLPPTQPSFLSVKQLTWIPGGRNNTLNRHHRRDPQSWQLRAIYDRQLTRRRLDAQIKLLWRWWRQSAIRRENAWTFAMKFTQQGIKS